MRSLIKLCKPLLADVRAAIVSLLVTSAILIGAPAMATIKKLYLSEPVPWTIFIVVVCVGIVLLIVAIRLYRTLPVITEEPTRDLQLHSLHKEASQQAEWPVWVAPGFKEKKERALAERINKGKEPVSTYLPTRQQSFPVRFTVSYDSDDPACMKPYQYANGESGIMVRLVVESRSGENIPGCKGELLSLFKDGNPALAGINTPLSFAPANELDARNKTIVCGIPSYLEVIWIPAPGHIATIKTPNIYAYPHYQKLDHRTVYTLEIAVSSNAVPASVVLFEAKFIGSWQFSSYQIIRDLGER